MAEVLEHEFSPVGSNRALVDLAGKMHTLHVYLPLLFS